MEHGYEEKTMTLDDILVPCICDRGREMYNIEYGKVRIFCKHCKRSTQFHGTSKLARREWNETIAQEQSNDHNESTPIGEKE